MTPAVYTIDEFKKTFKIGHTKTFEEIKTGRLQTYNVGRRRFISGRAADDWQRRLEEIGTTVPNGRAPNAGTR